jgi:predicted permease
MGLLKWMWRRGSIEQDLDDEIRAHFNMAIADRVAAGEDPESARLAAIKEFGNVLQTQEASRHVWRGRLVAAVTDFWQDLRFGLRMLRKNAAFSTAVVFVLALGIGGNATVFSVFKGLALKPLPGVRDSASLSVVLTQSTNDRPRGISVPDYRHIREHARSFDDLAGSIFVFGSVGRGAEATRVLGELVSGNYFEVLGVGAQLGRTILPSDDGAPGRHPVAVISDGMWRRVFGADPEIVGRTMYFSGQPLTIIGVAAPGFRGTVVSMIVDDFAPITMQPQLQPPDRLDERTAAFVMVSGHLRPGIALADAAAEVRVMAAQLDADRPLRQGKTEATVVPIWQSPFGAQTYMLPAIAMLGGMGVLILLVVCANVANLVLVRGVSRQGELAVRTALGASRRRLLRLLFVENLVLAVPGAAAGILMAWLFVPYFAMSGSSAAPAQVGLDVAIDAYVITFALVLSVGCALVFGFVPALRISRVDIAAATNDVSPRLAAGGRLRSMLVVSQVAASLVLLVGTGLVLRSAVAARQASGGFDPRHVTATVFDLQPAGYDTPRGRVFFNRLLDALESDPTFSTSTMATNVPLSLVDTAPRSFTIEGYTPRSDERLDFLFNTVGPGYFRTLEIPLMAGREFTRRDDERATPVVVVNETLARAMWQSPADALGKRLRTLDGEWHTVVGVAADVKYSRVNEKPRPYVYFHLLQSFVPAVTIHARTVGDDNHALERVRGHVQALDPQIPISRSNMLSEQIRVALSVYEMAAGGISMFGVLTMMLAAIGIYGLVAYSVRQSTQEIGIRIAIGARRSHVVWTFLKRGAVLAAIGAAIGIGLALVMSRSISALLYGVSSRDVMSFAAATAVVMAIALAASLFPALRASRTDPLTALRHH